ncbi:MAG: response regulator transcription factor [Clostridiales bacterium]|nr:response regulator transcription factor [Clostridiales bacterium]
MFDILVVEDNDELRELFCTVLSKNGYNSIPARDGVDALSQIERKYVDLIICDIMMPRMDGYELTQALRDANYTQPILMITAKESILDKQKGFLVGTDDYMVKPVDIREMLCRVVALLRRSQITSERKLTLGSTVLDYNCMTASVDGVDIPMHQKEFLLLYKLASYVNHIFTRRQIMDEIWGLDSDTDPHTLDVHISRLRDRFKSNFDFEIVTVRGLGYKVVRKS